MSIFAYPWVLPVMFGSLIAIVAILGGVISDCVTNVSRTNLKRSMVEQGYTVEQINSVMNANVDVGKAKKPSPTKG